jgi:hypothetical protein
MFNNKIYSQTNNIGTTYKFEYDEGGNRVKRSIITFDYSVSPTGGITEYQSSTTPASIEDELVGLESVTEPINDITITLYPNPVRENLFVQMSELVSEKAEYQLIDINGKNILTNRMKKEIETINFSQTPPGTYFLRIKIDNDYREYKIIKH